ncbi:di-copper centre-containing protein [Rutstroemia sp. NJR-2017a WRK4]|nr:di-copper centre-containing protein [Rutstroemia sp. NJR-2017a WRK4]
MNIHLGTKEIPQLLFWFSITVTVTINPESSISHTKLLYFVIPGSLFDWSKYNTYLLLEAPTSGYSLDTSTAIKQASISSDYTSIFRIHFQLLNHSTIFIPSTEEHTFTPISDNILQLLTDLQSLSQTKEFWAYIPSERSNLTNLRKRIDRLHRGTFTGNFTTQNIYKPSITNFNQFVKKKNPAKLNSDPLPAYTSGSQNTGIKHKGIHYNNDLDQVSIETESDEELYIEQEREHKYIKISSNIIPNHRSSKVRFIEPYSEDLSFLKKTVSYRDITKFNRIRSECIADICCIYEKRGSEWVLRN